MGFDIIANSFLKQAPFISRHYVWVTAESLWNYIQKALIFLMKEIRAVKLCFLSLHNIYIENSFVKTDKMGINYIVFEAI